MVFAHGIDLWFVNLIDHNLHHVRAHHWHQISDELVWNTQEWIGIHLNDPGSEVFINEKIKAIELKMIRPILLV